MSLKELAKTGRNAVWARRGVEECGGGFLGLFLLKLIEKSEERIEKKESSVGPKKDVFDRILNLFE